MDKHGKHDFHHRRPKSRGGKGTRENLSYVPTHHHAAWHTLFYNLTPEDIAEKINSLWIDPGFYFVVKRRQ